MSVTERNSIRLTTLDVPAQSGPLTATSSGTARYQELQFSVRRRFAHDQQIFVSYVRSETLGGRTSLAQREPVAHASRYVRPCR